VDFSPFASHRYYGPVDEGNVQRAFRSSSGTS